jgi:hypothetical protein
MSIIIGIAAFLAGVLATIFFGWVMLMNNHPWH